MPEELERLPSLLPVVSLPPLSSGAVRHSPCDDIVDTVQIETDQPRLKQTFQAHSTCNISTMSSMHNAIPRRSHKERSQPHSRTKRGLLEKRKDYLLRSQDHKRKQQTLKRLSEKASERNPDEFYFSMARERTEKGVAVADRPGSTALSVKEIKPLKMQDVVYLRTMRNIERRRIERLKNGTPGTSGQKGTKITFAEDIEEGISPCFHANLSCTINWAATSRGRQVCRRRQVKECKGTRSANCKRRRVGKTRETGDFTSTAHGEGKCSQSSSERPRQ